MLLLRFADICHSECYYFGLLTFVILSDSEESKQCICKDNKGVKILRYAQNDSVDAGLAFSRNLCLWKEVVVKITENVAP